MRIVLYLLALFTGLSLAVASPAARVQPVAVGAAQSERSDAVAVARARRANPCVVAPSHRTSRPVQARMMTLAGYDGPIGYGQPIRCTQRLE